jgi:hypothetical protein
MPIIKQTLPAILSAVGIMIPGQALADRAPTAEERSRIESLLRNESFTRWGEIELDDGVWEVDDAYAFDGRKYDLKLHRDTLAIIRRLED